MFCKLPFLTIIFIGIVIFENKKPLSLAKDVSTESTKAGGIKLKFNDSKIYTAVTKVNQMQLLKTDSLKSN